MVPSTLLQIFPSSWKTLDWGWKRGAILRPYQKNLGQFDISCNCRFTKILFIYLAFEIVSLWYLMNRPIRQIQLSIFEYMKGYWEYTTVYLKYTFFWKQQIVSPIHFYVIALKFQNNFYLSSTRVLRVNQSQAVTTWSPGCHNIPYIDVLKYYTPNSAMV